MCIPLCVERMRVSQFSTRCVFVRVRMRIYVNECSLPMCTRIRASATSELRLGYHPEDFHGSCCSWRSFARFRLSQVPRASLHSLTHSLTHALTHARTHVRTHALSLSLSLSHKMEGTLNPIGGKTRREVYELAQDRRLFHQLIERLCSLDDQN